MVPEFKLKFRGGVYSATRGRSCIAASPSSTFMTKRWVPVKYRNCSFSIVDMELRLADMAVAVHPDDERYKSVVGKHVVLPITGRRVPIVADEHADPELAAAR